MTASALWTLVVFPGKQDVVMWAALGKDRRGGHATGPGWTYRKAAA